MSCSFSSSLSVIPLPLKPITQTPQHILRNHHSYQVSLFYSQLRTADYLLQRRLRSSSISCDPTSLRTGYPNQKDLHCHPLETITSIRRSSTCITEASDWYSSDRTGWRLCFSVLRSTQRTGQHWMKSAFTAAIRSAQLPCQ